MKEDASAYLISGILFLLTAIIFIFFSALGDKTGDLIAGSLFALIGRTKSQKCNV